MQVDCRWPLLQSLGAHLKTTPSCTVAHTAVVVDHAMCALAFSSVAASRPAVSSGVSEACRRPPEMLEAGGCCTYVMECWLHRSFVFTVLLKTVLHGSCKQGSDMLRRELPWLQVMQVWHGDILNCAPGQSPFRRLARPLGALGALGARVPGLCSPRPRPGEGGRRGRVAGEDGTFGPSTPYDPEIS